MISLITTSPGWAVLGIAVTVGVDVGVRVMVGVHGGVEVRAATASVSPWAPSRDRVHVERGRLRGRAVGTRGSTVSVAVELLVGAAVTVSFGMTAGVAVGVAVDVLLPVGVDVAVSVGIGPLPGPPGFGAGWSNHSAAPSVSASDGKRASECPARSLRLGKLKQVVSVP